MLRNSVRHIIWLLLFFPAYSYSQNFFSNPPHMDWRQINTGVARVIFPAAMDSQARRISNVLALLKAETTNTIGGKLRKWNVVLQNQTTNANAYVRLAPVISEFYMMPNQNNFAEGSMSWDDNLAIHESRHMQQLSNFKRGLTRVFSILMGQQGQLLANGMVVPDYFFEGDAVYQETLVSEQGRGRFPYFFNSFKSIWQSGRKISWMKLRSGSYRELLPDQYPLGYMMVAYGVETQGPDFWKKVTNDAVHFRKLFYPFNRSIEKHTGKTYKRFREDALQFFKDRAAADSLKQTDTANYLTSTEPNNVINYLYPQFAGGDSIIVAKESYRRVGAFYILTGGKENRIRNRNAVVDGYFSYSNGKIVYSSFQSDPRWANRDYTVLQVLDIKTGKQKQLSRRSRLFSPALNKAGDEIIAVEVVYDGSSKLVRIDANSGKRKAIVPNPGSLFFTQTKYIDENLAVSAARKKDGTMALVKIDLQTGNYENITAFSNVPLGYPFVSGDSIFYSMTDNGADKLFVANMRNGEIRRLTDNDLGVYFPSTNNNGKLIASAFTIDGMRIMEMDLNTTAGTVYDNSELRQLPDLYAGKALNQPGAGILSKAEIDSTPSEKYRQHFQLFNFHSRRPIVADPEFGYNFKSDNILLNFKTELSYVYNRTEKSHTAAAGFIYGRFFPLLNFTVESSFNRQLTEIIDSVTARAVNFSSAKMTAGFSIPLSFTGGRTNKYVTVLGAYNVEQLYYRGIGKNIFDNRALKYGSAGIAFSNISQQARQHVNPHWAQTITLNYRDAFNTIDSRKFVGTAGLYFPGLFINHSLLLQGAYQRRDSLPDLFSNIFPYSRGYEALSTRRMATFGVNYQLPIAYPEIGFGNILFLLRTRLNAFYDHTDAYARVNGKLGHIIHRSAGGELFFDTKLWNALPFSFGVRYSHLLDNDLVVPGRKGKWDLILFNIVPR